MASNPVRVSWETRVQAVVGMLKGVGFAGARKALRRLCETGDAQLVLEASAAFLLDAGMASGEVPHNAGMMTRDLAVATEAALLDVANKHALGGSVLVPRHASVENLHAELCKQWIRSFSAPIPETYDLERGLEDPEIQARLTVVALKLRELLDKYRVVNEHEDPSGNVIHSTKSDMLLVPEDEMESVCSAAALAMFLAFQTPNETNHQLIHGSKKDAG